jgi:localization factor PodJL
VGERMKFGRPWNVEGIRPRARETARAAARRSGMTVGEWLNSVIIEQAAEEGISPLHAGAGIGDHDPDRADEELAAINNRLADLTRQLDRIERGGTGVLSSREYAEHSGERPKERSGESTPRQLAEAIARLDQRLDQMITEGHSAAGEIERRVLSVDRALQGLGRARMQAAFLEPTPADHVAQQPASHGDITAIAAPTAFEQAARRTSDLAGLEQHLHRISHQIDSLARPCDANAAAEALRADLADIKQTLREAMPSRAVEAIESEIRRLAERMDSDRNRGVDPATLANLERGLAEVRDVLRGLTPAERLVGFDQAVQILSRKIDVLAAGNQDPHVLQQIDVAVGGLRGIISQVASGDALASVASDVRLLAEKLERIDPAGNDILHNLEKRIASIADALETVRIATGRTVPRLDAMMSTLNDKLDRMQGPGHRPPASAQLEDRITTLVEKLDASEARLTHLGSIERGLTDLAVHLEEFRTRSAQAPGPAPPAASAAPGQAVEALKHHVAELKQTQSAAERRTEDSLETVHGTIGHVVDRLATIESDLRRVAQPTIPAARDPVEWNPVSGATPVAVTAATTTTQVGSSRLGHLEMPISGKPEIGAGSSRLGHLETPMSSNPETGAHAPSDETRAWTVDRLAQSDRAPARDQAEGKPVGVAEIAPNNVQTADHFTQSRLPSAKSDSITADGAPAQTALLGEIARVLSQPVSDPSVPSPSAPASAKPSDAMIVTTFGPPPTKETLQSARLTPSATRQPIDPALPPDTPLEPGMGKQRVEASKAGRVSPPPQEIIASNGPVDPTPRAEFIAAARRAAQAAAGGRADTRTIRDEAPSAPGKTLTQRVKSLFVGGGVLLIVVGLLRFGFDVLDLGTRAANDDVGSTRQAAKAAARPSPIDPAPAEADAGVAVVSGLKAEQARSAALAHFLSRASSLEASLAAHAPQVLNDLGVGATASAGRPDGKSGTSSSNPVNGPAVGDITGAIPPPSTSQNVSSPTAAKVPETDQSPAPIAGTALQAALAAGNPAAAYEMGCRYAEGRGMAANLGQAALWFDRAAKAGSIPALFRLAALYEKGDGLKKNLQEARQLYIAAAEKGHAKAMHNLAVLYTEGVDGKPNYTVAAQWFSKAASYAIPDSQYNLGVLYARGIGVELNLTESYKWFALAAAQGDRDAAQKRDDVAARLDAPSLEAARLAVQTFVAETQPLAATASPAPSGGWDQMMSGAALPKAKPATRVTVPQQKVLL